MCLVIQQVKEFALEPGHKVPKQTCLNSKNKHVLTNQSNSSCPESHVHVYHVFITLQSTDGDFILTLMTTHCKFEISDHIRNTTGLQSEDVSSEPGSNFKL